jgi:DNA polymerase-3 subunit beta
MQWIAGTADSLTALQWLAPLIERQATLPALSGVTITADPATRSITWTVAGFHHGAQWRQSADIITPGTITVPLQALLDWIRRIPADKWQAETGEATRDLPAPLRLRTARSRVTLHSFGDDRLPMPDPATGLTWTLDVATMSAIARTCGIAVDAKAMNPTITQLHVRWDDRGMQWQATDGRRLARVRLPYPNPHATAYDALIPPAFLRHLSTLPDSTPPVTWTGNPQRVTVTGPDWTFTTQLTPGVFPSLDAVLTPPTITTLTGDRRILQGTLERALLMQEHFDQLPIVRWQLDPDTGLTVTSHDPTVGSLYEVFDATDCPITGERLTLTFNPHYLLAALRALPTDQVHLAFSGASSAVVVTDCDDPAYIHAILPIRTTAAA